MTVRKFLGTSTEALSDLRQVRVICSTSEQDRTGDIVIQSGIDFSAYMASGAGPVLWNHNSDVVIAKCIELGLINKCLTALVQFPPEGEDPEFDRYYQKIKFGSVSGVSIGFAPVEFEPLDPKNTKRGPQKYVQSDLMEFSFTPIPANPSSIVQERSMDRDASNWKVGSSLNLPCKSALPEVQDLPFEGDLSILRKGCLAYDASNVDERAAYQIPFAECHEGEWIVTRSSLKKARKMMENSEFPNAIKIKSDAVLSHYEAKMTKPLLKSDITVKSLWHVSWFASILSDLGYLRDSAEWEAAIEEDGSTIPAQIGEALVTLGNLFLGMAAEEVAELLADALGTEDDADVVKTICGPGATRFAKSIVMARTKTGDAFEGAKVKTVADALQIRGLSAPIKITGDTPDLSENPVTDKVKAVADTHAKRKRMLETLGL